MKPAKAVKTVRVGSLRIDVRRYSDGRFGFDYQPPGCDRVKVRLNDLAAASERAQKIIGTTQAGKVDLLGIDPAEFGEFLRWKSARLRAAMVPELVTAFLRVLHRKEVSEYHYNDTKSVLEKFAARFPGEIKALARSEVESWLDSFEVGPKRWNAMRAHVVALVRFARSDNFVGSERTPVEQIEKRKVSTQIKTFTVPQAIQLLKSFDPRDKWLPAVVLGLFAHVRPEESCPNPDLRNPKPPLAWEHFRWDKMAIKMPKEVSKVGRPRLIPILDVVTDLLRPWRHAKGPVAPRKKIGNQMRRWVKVSGVAWSDDILRHTSASYRLAIIQDIPQLALEMGSSQKMIYDHYLDLKFEDEAKEYYAIRAATLWPGWNSMELSAA